MFIRDLKVGQVFTLTGKSTPMCVEHIVSGGGRTVITYRIPGSNARSEFYLAGMSTCTLIGD